MKANDISFKNEQLNAKFNFRVGALITNKDKILLQKSDDNDYYSLIGGRVSFFENTEEALIREIYEESGVLISPLEIKLIDVVENFFVHNAIKFHELLFIYKIEGNTKLTAMNNFKTKDKEKSVNTWINIDDLNKYKVLPDIIKDIINEDTMSHDIINNY